MHYTAATRPVGRFARDMACSECGGPLVVMPQRDQSQIGDDPRSLGLAESIEAPAVR